MLVKPKLNYENKDDRKFKVVLGRPFLEILKFIFSDLTRNFANVLFLDI